MPPKVKSKVQPSGENIKAVTSPSKSLNKSGEDSDSSSDETESDTTSTESESLSESEADSSKNQHKNLAPAFTLSCLRDWDSQKLSQCFEAYVSRQKDAGKNNNVEIVVPKITKVEDFTPWWDEFSNPNRKSSQKAQKTHKIDPDTFDNWFDKSRHGTGTSSWLSGPGPSKPSPQKTPAVEDIVVPSIYEQIPKTKGRRALKKERKAEREKTLGKKWFDMRAPEVDDATRMDMEMIRMRGALDPKRFFKHNDRRALPKYFQMGTVVDEGTDFFSSRLTKKQRKQTLVEELMADANVRQYNKRKYSEVQQKMRSKKKFKGK